MRKQKPTSGRCVCRIDADLWERARAYADQQNVTIGEVLDKVLRKGFGLSKRAALAVMKELP